MAESLGRAVLELTASIAPLEAKLAEGRAASESMAKSTAGGFKSGITKAAIPAAIAVGAVALALHKSVDAAEEDQVAEARLTKAYKDAGLNINHYRSSIEDTVKSSASLGFKSGDVKQALGSLIIATGSNAKATKDLGLAQDIARFKGISLQAATKMLTMAQVGSTRAVKQLGINIIPVTHAQDKLKLATKNHTSEAYKNALAIAKQTDKAATAAQVNEVLTQKLGGQAEAYSKTAAGAKDKMGAELTLLEENIGKTFLPILTSVSTTLAGVTAVMAKHGTIVKILIGLIGGLAAAVLLYNIYMKLQPVLTAAATAAQWLFNAALDANPIGIVILALAALGVAFYLFHSKIKVVWEWIKSNWPLLLGILTGPFGLAAAEIYKHFGTIKNHILEAYHWVKNKAEEIGNALHDGIINPIKSIGGAVWGFINNIGSEIAGKLGVILGWGAKIGNHIVSGVINAAKGIGGAIVGVIVSAINGVIDHINSVLTFHVSVDTHVPGVGKVSFGYTSHIPHLADGGIVHSPTVALIGEKGPEAVVPLGRGEGLGGNITVNVSGVVGNEREVAKKIGHELQKLQDRGLGFAL